MLLQAFVGLREYHGRRDIRRSSEGESLKRVVESRLTYVLLQREAKESVLELRPRR